MNILLDTHAFIWFAQDHDRVSQDIKNLIEDPNNCCYISIGSIWEMAIKISLDRLRLSIPIQDIEKELESYGFLILPVLFRHLVKLSSLEFHHRDPFDRLLISQAQTDNLILISSEPEFKKYNVNLIW